LVAQAGCRVVVLSSTAHSFGSVDVGDLHYKKGRAYSPWGAYGQSKACNLLFAKVKDWKQQRKHNNVSRLFFYSLAFLVCRL
jgi:NAD(P)-dependent dehydrogenase (short-subunit alcohol dehydrogenase family)